MLDLMSHRGEIIDTMAGVERPKDKNGAMFELQQIEYKLGSPLTDEQREFAYNFNRDIITFANPGTGKTHTLTAGILVAQNYWGILPKKIFCMSYTNAATEEIKGRYKDLTQKMHSYMGVEFGTFHSLSNKILADSYRHMDIVKEYPPEETAEDMTQYLQQIAPSYSFDKKKARRIAKVIAQLNSAFVFDDENVQTKYAFQQLNLPLEEFKKLRRIWFQRGIINNTIEQGEIPLYCLYALLQKPEVGDLWKGKYEIMIVDEFQDLSLLDLQILSLVANKLIVVGDMKQQIYVFNGACPEIVDAYLEKRPNATICKLSQSFRCPQTIADLATRVIGPNLTEDSNFVGRDAADPERVTNNINIIERRNIDWDEAFKDTDNNNLNDILILYRNNASTVPVIETLYSKKIPYRCPKFVKVTEIPVINTMCDLASAAWQPTSQDLCRKALSHFPEFRFQQYNIPVLSAMRSSNKSLLDVNYRFDDSRSTDIINAMRNARQSIMDKKSAGAVLAKLRDVYMKHIFPNEWIDESEVLYYLNMAAPVCNNFTYAEMINREELKALRALECQSANIGVRCYTMHSSKGLEGKTVYMLDVNEGVFPNDKVITRKHKAGCDYDAALDIRSERNLLYVAITRAKENLIISYSDETLATLLKDPSGNAYRYYDEVYKKNHKLFKDTEYFSKILLEKKEA